MNNELMLSYLTTSSFYEGYELSGLRAVEVLRKFAEEDGLQTLQIFYADLAELLSRNLDEEEARVLWMEQAQSIYDPKVDDMDYLDWLRTILFTVGAVLRQRWLTPRDSLTY